MDPGKETPYGPLLHSWQKRLLHPGMMCLFCDYFYFISPRGLRTGFLCNIMFSKYLMPSFLFCCVLSVLTTFYDNMSNWPNVHT